MDLNLPHVVQLTDVYKTYGSHAAVNRLSLTF